MSLMLYRYSRTKTKRAVMSAKKVLLFNSIHIGIIHSLIHFKQSFLTQCDTLFPVLSALLVLVLSLHKSHQSPLRLHTHTGLSETLRCLNLIYPQIFNNHKQAFWLAHWCQLSVWGFRLREEIRIHPCTLLGSSPRPVLGCVLTEAWWEREGAGGCPNPRWLPNLTSPLLTVAVSEMATGCTTAYHRDTHSGGVTTRHFGSREGLLVWPNCDQVISKTRAQESCLMSTKFSQMNTHLCFKERKRSGNG